MKAVHSCRRNLLTLQYCYACVVDFQLLPIIAYVVLNCADNGVTVYSINAVTVAALLIVHTVLC